MKVPLSWLREFVDFPAEPRQLGEDLTFVGLAVDGLEGRGDDVVLDLDVTTNRVDCMNVYGVAREVSVVYGVPLRRPDVSFAESGTPASEALRVSVEAPELCPRFCARVLDVRLGPSPAWMRDRLEAVGVRPINNVVDVTNYVMMEMGQPSHAFDLARVADGRLVVRWAKEGERLTTLDGVERTLAGRVGVVAGTQGALALAGIMGGASSEVSDDTRAIALEAAWWDPLSIRRASKAIGLHTEASHRFERGADPEVPPAATARIAHLLAKIGGGTARPGLIDSQAPRPRRVTTFRLSRASAVLGLPVPEDRARTILGGLGFGVKPGPARWEVEVPPWRGDVSREADLVEEVGRHLGIDRMPSTVPAARGAEGLRPSQVATRAIREILVGQGLTEVINYAFVSDAAAGGHAPPRRRMANPLSEEQGVLRSSLVVPGLLGTLRANLRQGRREVRVFEVGRVFGAGAGAPVEESRVAILLTGAVALHWSAPRRMTDFFDAKGALELLARRLGIGPFSFATDGVPGFLHPGKSAVVALEGRPRGFVGSLHPDVAEAWELRDEVVVAEVGLDALVGTPPPPVRFQALPRSPTVERDVSVIGDVGVTAAAIEARIRAAAGPLLRAVSVVDRFLGPPVPEGKASLTFGLVYQDPGRTLTGEEVQASVERVVRVLRDEGLEIRGE